MNKKSIAALANSVKIVDEEQKQTPVKKRTILRLKTSIPNSKKENELGKDEDSKKVTAQDSGNQY